jgi:hypothetical protein
MPVTLWSNRRKLYPFGAAEPHAQQGYEVTRKAAMTVLAKRWQRE